MSQEQRNYDNDNDDNNDHDDENHDDNDSIDDNMYDDNAIIISYLTKILDTIRRPQLCIVSSFT